jgi:glutathione S-transferase
MKLYFSPGACSLSPRIVMLEAGIPFESQQVDVRTKTLVGGGDYRAITDKGYVPALQLDNGDVLTEGPAMVQYLADLNPEAQLAPAAGSFERVRLQEMLNYITSEIHKGLGILFDPGLNDDAKAHLRKKVGLRFDWLSKQLGQQDFVMGAKFGIADAYLFTVLNWCGWLGIDLSGWPVLAAYQARIAARPKVQEALRAEGLVK